MDQKLKNELKRIVRELMDADKENDVKKHRPDDSCIETATPVEKYQTKLLEQMDGRLDRVETTLVLTQKDMEHHISRTDHLQNIVEPMHERYMQWKGALKLLAFLATLGGLIKLSLFFLAKFGIFVI